MAPQTQSGVLPYRHHKKRGLEVLLVKKPLSQNWGIPKGKLAANLSLAENAAKEAFEEAGIRGIIHGEAAASYRAMKRRGDQQVLIEVWVFLLEVTYSAKKWPEKTKRLVNWYSMPDAKRILREPVIVQLCRDLEDEVPDSQPS
jgi:ADP-ribose pyrophosphatase YjhB (NUDIX family)